MFSLNVGSSNKERIMQAMHDLARQLKLALDKQHGTGLHIRGRAVIHYDTNRTDSHFRARVCP